MTHPVSIVVEREFRVFAHLWRGSVVTAVVTPVLFIAALGLGLGDLVDANQGDVAGLTYLAFVTPGVLAASSMQSAVAMSLWPVMGGFKWIRTYHGIIAGPIRPADVFAGHVLWIALRTAAAAVVFLVIAAALGAIHSPWAVLAVPAVALCAAAFAAPVAAFVTTQDDDRNFAILMRVVVMPLFLFSGTFFPIDQLPAWLQPLAWASPLYHGVELARMATTGAAGPAAAIHVGLLSVTIGAGAWWGRAAFTRRLTP